jgi:hypothetical protein
MGFVWFVLAAAALITVGVMLGVFAALIQSGTISRMEEALGYDEEPEPRRRTE